MPVLPEPRAYAKNVPSFQRSAFIPLRIRAAGGECWRRVKQGTAGLRSLALAGRIRSSDVELSLTRRSAANYGQNDMKDHPGGHVFGAMKKTVAGINKWASTKCNSLLRRTRDVIRSAFGQISWEPPVWLSRGTGRCRDFTAANPKLATSWILGIFALACVSAWGWHYYKNLPQPHRVTATISPIPVTKVEKELEISGAANQLQRIGRAARGSKKEIVRQRRPPGTGIARVLALGRRHTPRLSAF